MFTPTLTGLGERSHLARAAVGLDVHITVLKYMARRSALRRYRELAASHHAAVTMPERVADLLVELATLAS